jgi:hypothetical protein
MTLTMKTMTMLTKEEIFTENMIITMTMKTTIMNMVILRYLFKLHRIIKLRKKPIKQGYGNDADEDDEMGNRLTRLTLKSSNAGK